MIILIKLILYEFNIIKIKRLKTKSYDGIIKLMCYCYHKITTAGRDYEKRNNSGDYNITQTQNHSGESGLTKDEPRS